LERTHQVCLLLPNQLSQQVGTTNQPPSLTTFRARRRSGWRVAAPDQVDGNGAARNRRRISRHSVKAALTMDTVVDTADEDAAVEDIEVEAIVEMANQDVDVAAIEDVATHKQHCSNCLLQTPKATGRIWAFLRCTKSFLRFAISVSCGSKISIPSSISANFLCSPGRLYRRTGHGSISCVRVFFSLFLLQLVPSGSRTRVKKTISYEYDQTFLGFGWRLSELILRYERMDWYQNYVFFSALLLAWRFDTWVAERTINGVERVGCTERLAGYCLLALFYGLDMVGLGA